MEVFDSLDSNKSGRIEFSEFVTASMAGKVLANEENLRLAFKVLDSDKDGKVTANEMSKAFGNRMIDDDRF